MIDLHRHLEAALTVTDLQSLVVRHNIDLPRDEAGLRQAVTFHSRPGDLRSFLEPFNYIQNCFVSTAVIREYTVLAIKRLHEEGISYAELRLSPFYMAGLYSGSIRVAPEGVVEAVVEGCEEAQKMWATRVGIILIVARELDVQHGQAVIDLALKYRERVCGVDLAGDEANYPPELFVDVFARAREAGLPITIHAGEAGPARNVQTAIELLGARRIGHGVAVATDPEVLALVRDTGVVLEMCPISNWLTGAVVGSPASHPLMALHRAGIPLTVNTDDPMLQNTWLVDDLRAAKDLGASDDDLATFEQVAAKAAFGQAGT